MVREARPLWATKRMAVDRLHSTKIDSVELECRHPRRKGFGVRSGLSLVGFEDREPLFKNGACALSPIIEVASHDQRSSSVHHSMDAVTGPPDLAPAIRFEQAEMQREGMQIPELRDADLGMEDPPAFEGTARNIDVLVP